MNIKRRFSSGFTLIELLMVIAIIGVLASLIIVSLRGAEAKARDTKVKTNVASIDKALTQYEVDNQKFYVGTTATIDISPTSALTTALASYIRSGAFTVATGQDAKYTTNAAGTSFAIGWELENTTETAVNTGTGIYSTNNDGVAGSVAVPATKSSGLTINRTLSNRVVISDAAGAYQGMGQFTISFWVKRDTPADYERVIAKYRYSSGDTGSWVCVASTVANLGLTCTAYIGGSWRGITTPVNSFSTGQWYHVVYTYDPAQSSNKLKIYINGSMSVGSGSTSIAGSVGYTSGTQGFPVIIGASGDGVTFQNHFGGQIDDVRIYNTAFNDVAISSWYLQGRYLGNNASNLLGGWRLDEVSGTTASGTGSVGGNGTINGAATWIEGANIVGMEGIGSSLTGKAFVITRTK